MPLILRATLVVFGIIAGIFAIYRWNKPSNAESEEALDDENMQGVCALLTCIFCLLTGIGSFFLQVIMP